MPYADSDFFLAILKPNDWLKEKALALYKLYKGNIWTSEWTIVELLLLSDRFKIDPEKLVIDILHIAEISGNKETLLSTAHLMKENGVNTFDALHVVSSKSDKIISPDSVFDRIGQKRIKLEE